jgi:hypothetical protein
MRLDLELATNTPRPDRARDFAFYDGAQIASIKGSLIKESATRAAVLGADNETPEDSTA